MRRKMTFALLAAALALAAAAGSRATAAAVADKPDYNALVRLVESHYRVKHKGIPFLANVGVKTAKVVSSTVRKYSRFVDLKLAVFEDQDFARGGDQEFYAAVRRLMQPLWTPLVVVRGAEEGQTYTFTREDNGKFRVLICVIGERDGTVLEVGLNEEEFFKLLTNPEQETKSITDAATNQDADKDN
ncbi:MAG: hypothetical protein LC785_11635 [Acidobacteria bacterium]|nr:hypothetical protein [Acidobacteriota bacterium]MCA1642577.1 hypothetical protein [Acidobacteriota bacterium]